MIEPVTKRADRYGRIERAAKQPRQRRELGKRWVARLRDTRSGYRVLRDAWELALGEQLRDVQGGDALYAAVQR